jgi:hypothetical protein
MLLVIRLAGDDVNDGAGAGGGGQMPVPRWSVAATTRRAKHLPRCSKIAGVVQSLPQKYLSFRNTVFMI